MTEANKKQIGGTHYKADGKGEEHWDRVHRLGLDYYQGQATKYIERCWLKNGIQDLEKAKHFIEKYIELSKAQGRRGAAEAAAAPANCKYEAHITCHKEHAGTVMLVGEWTGWKFSEIDGDPVMGAKPFCYLTNYSSDYNRLLRAMKHVEDRLDQSGVLPLRGKVEQILFDSKTEYDYFSLHKEQDTTAEPTSSGYVNQD